MKPLAVSVEEAGRLVGLSKHTIRKYIRQGLIDAVRVGRRVLVPVASLERLLERVPEHSVAPDPAVTGKALPHG